MITLIKIIPNWYQVAMTVSRGFQIIDIHKLNIYLYYIVNNRKAYYYLFYYWYYCWLLEQLQIH